MVSAAEISANDPPAPAQFRSGTGWTQRRPALPVVGGRERYLLRHVWHRKPYFLTIRAIPPNAAAQAGVEATIGTRGSKVDFLSRVDRTVQHLLQRLGHDMSEIEFVLPDAAESIQYSTLAGSIDRIAERVRDRLMTEWWGIGEMRQPCDPLQLHGVVSDVDWWPDRRDYIADPFPWPGPKQILCEEMPLSGGHGRIIALPMDGGQSSEALNILTSTGHHSYPCLLEEEETVWFLPESAERGATRLYQLDGNACLTPVCDIAPALRMADGTLFRHGELYWIAYTDLDLGDHDNLCLLYAHQPQGPWQQHPQNPVKIDIRGARCAGMPIARDGRLFRPGQNCAATYGAGITLYEIHQLTPTAFAESPLASLIPDPNGRYPHGLHTLVSHGDRIWIDGKRFIFSPRVILARLLSRLNLLAG